MVDSFPLYGKRFYQNPLQETSGQSPTNADPYVMKFQGRYYCYSSHIDGVQVSVSRDLVNWQYLGFTLQEEDRHEFWAPCVIYVEGIFYMYYSSAPKTSDDPHDERLRLAISTAPEGPFHYRKTLFNKFSIDAEVVRDKNANFFLFYSTNDVTGTDPENTGTSILVDRLVDFDRVAGEPQPVIIPTLDEEIFKENRFGDGRDWHTVEGAAYLEHHKKAYLLYSANAYIREDYYISYAWADKNAAIHELDWEKYPNDYTYYPLIRRSKEVQGTGHNSLVKAPNNVGTWLVYHGRDASEPLLLDKEQRTMRIDPLFFDGDALMTYAPSSTKQPAPPLPDIYDFFDQPNEGLTIQTGHADLSEKGWVTTEAPFLALYDKEYAYYHLEMDLSAKPASIGSKNGAVISYHRSDYYTSVFLRSGTSTLVVEQVKNGILTDLATFRLRNFDATVSQNLRIVRCFAYYDFYLNDAYIGRVILDGTPAQVGICSSYTATIFHYFAVTEAVDLFAEKMKNLGNFFTSPETVAVNADNQLASFKRTPATLSTALMEGYQYRLTYILPNANSSITLRLFLDEEELEIILKPMQAISEKLQMQQNHEKAENNKSSITFLMVDGKMILLFKNRIYQYELPFKQDRIACQLDLRKAALDAYEMVKLN